ASKLRCLVFVFVVFARIWFMTKPHEATFYLVAFRKVVTRRVPMTAFAVKNFSHSLPSLNRMLGAINSDGRLSAGQTDAFGFLSQHVDLLPGHRCTIGFQHPGKLVHDLLSTPRFFRFQNNLLLGVKYNLCPEKCEFPHEEKS